RPRRGAGGRARHGQTDPRDARRREALPGPGLDPGREGDDRAVDRTGHRHPGEGVDPRPEAVSTDRTAAIRGLGIRVERGDKTILRGVELAAYPGEVLGVLGPSGAGKSTLFRALVGEIGVGAGTVELLGNDVTRLPLWARARRGLSYVPQTPSVLW